VPSLSLFTEQFCKRLIELADNIDISLANTKASQIKTETHYSKWGKLRRGRDSQFKCGVSKPPIVMIDKPDGFHMNTGRRSQDFQKIKLILQGNLLLDT